MGLMLNTALRTALFGSSDFSSIFTGGNLYIRTGGGPDVNSAMDGSLLCTISALSFDTPALAIIANDASWSGTNAATGVAGYFRMVNSGATMWVQGACGKSSGELRLAETSLVSGEPLVIDDVAFTLPAPASIEFNTALRTALLGTNDLKTLFTDCDLQIRTGAPAGVDDAAVGTLLNEMNDVNFAAASAGVIGKTGTWSSANVATGTAGHFRLIDSTTTYVIQGTVGESLSDIILGNTSLVSGKTLTVGKFQLTMPEA